VNGRLPRRFRLCRDSLRIVPAKNAPSANDTPNSSAGRHELHQTLLVRALENAGVLLIEAGDEGCGVPLARPGG